MVKAINIKKEASDVVKTEETDPVVKVEQQEQPAQSKFLKKKKNNRIIIRNLIVDVNEKHIRKLCSEFGEILDIQIPLHPLKKCSRGFAFVEFKTKNMCLKAIKELNATQFKGRTIIVDLAVSKQKFAEAKNNMNSQTKNQDQDEIKQEHKQDKNQGVNQGSKQKKTKKQQKIKKQEDRNNKNEVKQQKEEDLSSTIFIRNLSSTISQKEVFNFAKKFGKIRFVKLVIDPQTNECRGSAFVKYFDSTPAQRLIQYSRQYEQSLLPNSKNKRFQQDPQINFDLNGRIIKIFPAESRKQLATKLEDRDNKDNKDKKVVSKPLKKIRKLQELISQDRNNKRHLNLAVQGFNKAQPWMKKEDQEKFQYNEAQKVQKLKNPNNQVSQTRIILKYLPKQLSESSIRQICQTFLHERHQNKHNLLQYCKLMLDSERKKSSGVAFLQFSKHNVSMDFLRWLNDARKEVFDNACVLSQFAIQDARKMIKINNRNKIHKNK